MADMTQNGAPPPPPGYSANDVVAAQGGGNISAPPPPPPPGYSADQIVPVSQSQPAPPSNSAPPKPTDQLSINSNDNLLTKAGKAVGGALEGVGEGVFSTAAGATDLANKILGDGKPGVVSDTLHKLAGDNETRSTAASVGYGGETLMEFMLGDEALKAMPLAKRLEVAAKTTKTLEGSPRIMQALRVGASVMKQAALHGAEGGIVQGAQTLVRSGGDVKEAAKDALTTAATGTVLGTATGGAAKVLGKVGKIAENAQGLADYAGNAQTKEEVAQSIGSKIDAAKDALHEKYENGIQDLNERLEGAEVSAQDNPLADKAKELLAEPMPEEHPVVSQAKQAAGDRLDKKVRSLLEFISTGELPPTEEAEAEAEEASKPSGLLDANGKPIAGEPVEPETEQAPPYKINDLVTLRQTIRKLADSYEYGDVNSRALRSLINDPNAVSPLDQTIEHLAQSSGDATALEDYRNLRSEYRDKINLFDQPVIQKLRDGKMDDAAKDFVGVVREKSAMPTAGKIRFNTDTLRGIIGDDGVKQFGKQVFGTMMQDSVEDHRFNPAKFMDTMKRVNDETKGDLFDLDNAQNGLRKLYRDAQSAATIQHLTRMGVLVPLGAAIGSTGVVPHVGLGLGSILGLTVAEGGGIAKGRELLNYIANHPAVWATYRAAGKAANSGAAEKAATALRGAASQASPAIRSGAKSVFQSLSGSLGR